MLKLLVFVLCIVCATVANAASLVNIISMYSTASATSVFIQEISNRMNTMQTEYEFRVSNLPGAAGDNSALRTISLAREGQNVLLWHGVSTYSFGKYVSANVNAYDRDKDLIPIYSFVGVPFHLLTRSDNFHETIESFKKKDKLYFANTAAVPTALLLNGILVKTNGLSMPKELSYSQGPEALKSVVIGEANYTIYTQSVSEIVGLKPIVTSSPVRTKLFPNVPTGAEVGMPDFAYVSTTTISVPKEKKEFAERLIPMLDMICKNPTFIERVEKLGYESKCFDNSKLMDIISADTKQLQKYESYVVSTVK